MPELVNSTDPLQAELELLRRSERQLKERQALLFRLAISHQDPDLGFDEKLRNFTREIGNYLAIERTSIWYLDRDNTALRCLNLYVRSSDKHFSGGELLTKKFPRYLKFLSQEGIIAADFAKTDVQTQEFDKEYLTKYGIESMLDTPLRVGDRLRGVLCCEHVGEARHWTEEDREFVISLSDLAALTLATHDVCRTEEMLRALLDSAAQGVVALDDDGRIVLVNSLVERMFLYNRKQLLGKPLDTLIAHDLSEPGLRFEPKKASSAQVLVPRVGEYFMAKRKDGTTFPVEIALSDVQLHDGRMSLALITDVTERVQIEQSLKKSEELYRSVVDDQVDLIARYTPDGIRTFANEAYCRFLGHTREDLIGRPIWDHVPEDDHKRMRENFARLTKDNPVLYYEHRDVTPKGKIVINQWIDRAIFDSQGNLREIQCIGRDVTQQRATEERLTAAERLESIAMLASGIAHDFNNLLTPILIYSENLQQRLKEGTIEFNQVQQIHLAADRAKTLVRQILTFGRKGERIERAPASLASMLRDTLQLIRLSVPNQIKLEIDIQEDCGVITSNVAEVYQIISNLCSNACYAMPEGGTISISARRRHVEDEDLTSGDYAEIVISDTGPGISPADLHRIFDPFFTTKPEGLGTGLGLSVVHGTVTELGGTIKVRSTMGKGASFTVLLPCSKTTAAVGDSEIETSLAPTKSHILLVDDDDLALKSMTLVLQQMGHQITPCKSAEEALSCVTLGREQYDVVLSDLTMPQMNGLELAKRIREIKPLLPILLISGDAGQLDENSAREAGVTGFVNKPAGSHELGVAIARVISLPSATVSPQPSQVRRHVLVIDDNELVRGSLMSLLKTIGFVPHAVNSLSEARRLLENQMVDAILVDNHLEGENGFLEIARYFEKARKAQAHVPLLIGMTGSECQPDLESYELDAFLAKPFSAEQLRDVLSSSSREPRSNLSQNQG